MLTRVERNVRSSFRRRVPVMPFLNRKTMYSLRIVLKRKISHSSWQSLHYANLCLILFILVDNEYLGFRRMYSSIDMFDRSRTIFLPLLFIYPTVKVVWTMDAFSIMTTKGVEVPPEYSTEVRVYSLILILNVQWNVLRSTSYQETLTL